MLQAGGGEVKKNLIRGNSPFAKRLAMDLFHAQKFILLGYGLVALALGLSLLYIYCAVCTIKSPGLAFIYGI